LQAGIFDADNPARMIRIKEWKKCSEISKGAKITD